MTRALISLVLALGPFSASAAGEDEAQAPPAFEPATLEESVQKPGVETERAVNEEMARLESLTEQASAAKQHFAKAREQLSTYKETVLGWQRRSREAQAAGPLVADPTYDELRRALNTSRDELSAALDLLGSSALTVPVLVTHEAFDMTTEAIRQRRGKASMVIAEAEYEERSFRDARAAALLDEMTALNRERLALLRSLSTEKRDATVAFTPQGFGQAQSEARHLALLLGYHRHVMTSVLLGDGTSSPFSLWRAGWLLVRWLMFVLVFAWARRRVPLLLRLVAIRVDENERNDRRTSPSRQSRALRILREVHQPLEWGLFLVGTMWLLPAEMTGLLEVQLLSSIIGWVLGGTLVVHLINVVAASDHALPAHESSQRDALRLRSLKLVGRTVVAFALILVLSDRLVERGTIYTWVFSTCWFAGIPIFLVLVRWWRAIVFERIEITRNKSALRNWVLAHRSGWSSFLAAMIGAVMLFTAGTIKQVRVWLSGFDLARRAHAYAFKRDLDKMSEEPAAQALVPLSGASLEAMAPELPPGRWLSCPADQQLKLISVRVAARRGGLVVLIGPRGMGKTSLLRKLADEVPGALMLQCSAATSASTLEEAVTAMGELPALVLLDEVQMALKPIIGGLKTFDGLISHARKNSTRSTWVFSIDAAVWSFLERSRDARPMFDETYILGPWSELNIGALLSDRCAHAGVVPSFEALLDELPRGADESDHLEALRAKRLGYERMLWDHAAGNPALALDTWRRSLGVDDAGVVHVGPLQVPDATTIDHLPDSTLFILRAVLQLAPASIDDVAEATRVSPEQVRNAFLFGQSHGFFSSHDDRVRVTWPWLRSIWRLLARRHILVNQ